MSNTINTSNDVLRARSKQTTLTETQDVKANQAGGEFNIATDAKVITLQRKSQRKHTAVFMVYVGSKTLSTF